MNSPPVAYERVLTTANEKKLCYFQESINYDGVLGVVETTMLRTAAAIVRAI